LGEACLFATKKKEEKKKKIKAVGFEPKSVA
jgi:hypothetical protein